MKTECDCKGSEACPVCDEATRENALADKEAQVRALSITYPDKVVHVERDGRYLYARFATTAAPDFVVVSRWMNGVKLEGGAR